MKFNATIEEESESSSDVEENSNVLTFKNNELKTASA